MLNNFRFCMCSLSAIFILMISSAVFAAPLCPVPIEVTQPNGDVITVTNYGDEFFSWQEDEKGNVITYDEESRSYKYAEIKDGKIVPTSLEVKGNTTFTLFSNEIFSHKIQREDIIPLLENAERVDYSQSIKDDSVQLMTTEGEAQETVKTKKLLTILIEFEDVKMEFSNQFWHDEMFDTTPGALSVVNYWKENANGVNIFEAADTSGIKKKEKQEGFVSEQDYIDIKYRIEEVSEGIVRVSLNMPHPIKTWDERDGSETIKTVELALRAIEDDFDFTIEQPHLVTIFAGYDNGISAGQGQGQVGAHTSVFPIYTSDGIDLGRYTVQGELQQKGVSVGIGTICHEIGHSVFYLPDLYFTNLPTGPSNALDYYSLMSFGSWGQRYTPPSDKTIDYGDPYAQYWGHVPSNLDPWCKIKCGFVTPILVTEFDGNINSISDTENKDQYNIIKVQSKADPKQYFLIENRQLIGFDKGLEALDKGYLKKVFAGGILIHHIDENVSYNYNNNTDMHTFIYIERSNNGSGRTNEEAKWAYSNEEGVNKFNCETAPNSNLYESNNLKSCSLYEECHPQTVESGISIEVLSESNSSMRVKVNVDEEYRIKETGEKFIDVFEDENFCNAIIEILSKDGVDRNFDDIISADDWAKLLSLESLKVSNRNIRSLKGIEHFSKLMDITCSNNELAELDFSSNHELIYIDCKNNRLTELNVSGCKNLLFFYCDNNLLKNLDIQDNNELMHLQCSNNELTQLNVKGNPDLVRLFCYDNYMDEDYTVGIIGADVLRDSLITSAIYFKYLPQKSKSMPTATPTVNPTATPTTIPTVAPTTTPTVEPTETPTAKPTEAPKPIETPIVEPTATPTPTVEPTTRPTEAPTPEPTETPEPYTYPYRVLTHSLDMQYVTISGECYEKKENAVIIFAVYSDDGRLISAQIKNLSTDGGSNFTEEFPYIDGQFKVFIWNMNTQEPYSEVYSNV